MSKIRQIVIGDVHGHYDGLITLLETISPQTDDLVYFLGDLIDRGPQSSQVVDFVKNSGYQCLLGNHEEMLLEVFAQKQINDTMMKSWLHSGGDATLASYGEAGIPLEDIEWMRSLPTYLDLGDFWLVHAGLDPRLPLEKQTSAQFCWIRQEFHRMQQPYFADKLIITGHTITFTLPGVIPGKLAQGNGWLDIDTGAYHPKSGWLTGFDLTNRLVYQVNTLRNFARILPLAEAVTQVRPSFFLTHRRLLRS